MPISLNESQDKVIAYPAPGDLYLNGQPALPVKLRDGYWLDNRGIGVNTVFTEYTYNAYSKLNRAPLQEDLIKSVIDFDPFLEIYNCGNRQGTETLQQINGIFYGKFGGCKTKVRLKIRLNNSLKFLKSVGDMPTFF